MSDQEFSDSSAESDAPERPETAEQTGTPEQPVGASGSAPPPPPPPAEGEGDSGSDNMGLMLVLSYLWILALIPLLVEKDSEVQWHAKNGLVWTVAEFLMHVVISIIGMMVFIGCFITPILMLAWLVVRVMAIMKALKGERMELPYLSDFVEKF